MKKNYFLSFLNNNSTACYEKSHIKSIFYIAMVGILLIPSLTKAQSTVHLSSTVNNGGFESGTAGWTLSVGAVNRTQFTIGTGAPISSPASGTNSAYITTNITTPAAPNSTYIYTNTALVKATHLYRTITIPAAETLIKLNFAWRGGGIAGEDRMRVFIVPTTYTPVYGTLITSCACGYTQLGLTEYVSQPAWGTAATITIPAAFAGTSFKLVFEWNDSIAGAGTQPVAIDNINLTSYNPLSDNCANAIPLTVSNSCTNETFTNVGATDSGLPTTTCGTYAGADVWYTAVVGGDGTLSTIVSSSGGLNDPVMAIYSGSCGALSLVQCVDDVNGLFPQINLTGRTAGEVLYIRIWPYTTSTTFSGTFNICATSPSCYTPSVSAATSITTTTATINWAPNPGGPPSGGYQYVYSTTNTAPGGPGTAAAGTSANLTGLTQNTTYYVFVRGFCGGTDYSAWSPSGSFTTIIPAPTTTGASFCAGGSGTLTGSALCTTMTNIGTTFSGTLNSATDPTADRMPNFTVSANPCSFVAGTPTNYTSLDFQVSATGTYAFTMANNTSYDSMAYITTGAFVPGNCSGGGTYLAGDDDTAGGLEPQITVLLTAGVTYTIYTQGQSSGANGPFTYNVSGPGSILATSAGTLQWWSASSGGSVVGSGTPFDPVASGAVANNTTPISTNFYAACSSFPNIRTGASFVILASPSSVISGSGSACSSGPINMSIALSGASPWTFTYTDGVTPVTISNTSTTPYTFSVTPTGVAVTYTVSALSNATCATTAASVRTGTGSVYKKTWTGGTANWSTATNWAPNGIPSASDCVVIANAGVPPVISGTNVYAYASNLTVNNSATLTINATNSLTVTDGVAVATTVPVGNLILNDDASLVQITNVGSNNNTGNVTFNRTAAIRRTDYVYWSSPFSALNASLISPATNPYYIYKWNPSVPNSNNGQGNWENGNDSPMVIGKGYIIRAPDLHPTAVTNFTTTVTGVPNNGAITTPITRGSIIAPLLGGNGVTITATDDNWNLVGNPYPSSIDAVAFLTQNSNLDGNVRLWTHGTPIGSVSASFYNTYSWGYADSYLTFNSSGPNPPGFGGKIGSGQGFFVSVDELSTTVAFNNTMRAYNYDNTEFFKGSGLSTNSDSLERSRIWLSILNESAVNNSTTLVCYINGATLNKDRLFDAPNKPTGNLNIYSLIGDQKMNIQGRPTPFDQSDSVPLGYTVDQNGIYKIGIAEVDGLFLDANQQIYLEDTALGILHDLRSNYYTFTTNSGTFDNRFNLRFTDSALGTPHNDIDTFNYISNNMLNIKSTKNIESVDIYDIGGKLIKSCLATDAKQTFETDFNYPNGVYLLKIKLDGGIYVTKKQLK